MENKKMKIAYIAIIILLIVAAVCLYIFLSGNSSFLNKSNLNVEYSTEKLTGEYEGYTAKIELSDSKVSVTGSGVTSSGNAITINSAGIYYITGSLSNGYIVVDTVESAEVQLVLDNASITSKETAPINCIKAAKLIITLADGSTNTLTDPSTYTVFTDTEDGDPHGTIFAKTNLLINGTGKLIINANYADGIATKSGGEIEISACTIEINSNDDGIQAKTTLTITDDANITVTSTGKGLKSDENIVIKSGNIKVTSKDDTIHSNGTITIDGGNFTLSSDDDGIHADTSITINNGNISISKSYEGIESNYIEINGGTINLKASDDGINVAGGNDGSSMGGRPGQNTFSSTNSSNTKLVINGGTINVDATGDGLDANGSMYINGGNIIVAGPTSNGNGPLDYDAECVVTGGNLIVYGSTGMWQNPSSNSTQYSLSFSKSGSSGDEIVVKDSSGNEIASFTAEKTYQALCVSNDKIKQGETYTLYVNGETASSLTASSIVSSNVSGSMGGGMQGGNGQGGMRNMQSDSNGSTDSQMQMPNMQDMQNSEKGMKSDGIQNKQNMRNGI